MKSHGGCVVVGLSDKQGSSTPNHIIISENPKATAARRCVGVTSPSTNISWPDLRALYCSQTALTRAGLDMYVVFNIWHYILPVLYNDTTSRARALAEPTHQTVGCIYHEPVFL